MKYFLTVLCAVALVVLAGAEKKEAPKVVVDYEKLTEQGGSPLLRRGSSRGLCKEIPPTGRSSMKAPTRTARGTVRGPHGTRTGRRGGEIDLQGR